MNHLETKRIHLVLPGEKIGQGERMMRGHGTYNVTVRKGEMEEEEEEEKILRACVAGRVQHVDRLVSVVGVNGRYSGQVGDLVIGKIVEVGHKVWKVDIGARRLASLALSSVHLPQDAQRIRTRQDALAMRELFQEGDLVVAEIQMSRPDGPPQLQTRSTRYGRLSRGQLIKVKPNLIQRLPAHFISLKNRNLDLALGNNGWIWIQRRIPDAWLEEAASNEGVYTPFMTTGGFGRGLSSEAWKSLRDRHASLPLSCSDEQNVFRMAASAMALSRSGASVTPASLELLFALSLRAFPDDPVPMTLPHHASRLVQQVLSSQQSMHTGKQLGYLQHMLDYGASLDYPSLLDRLHHSDQHHQASSKSLQKQGDQIEFISADTHQNTKKQNQNTQECNSASHQYTTHDSADTTANAHPPKEEQPLDPAPLPGRGSVRRRPSLPQQTSVSSSSSSKKRRRQRYLY